MPRTRDHIKEKKRQIDNAYDRIMNCLRDIDELCDGKSETWNKIKRPLIIQVDTSQIFVRDLLKYL